MTTQLRWLKIAREYNRQQRLKNLIKWYEIDSVHTSNRWYLAEEIEKELFADDEQV